MDSFLSCCINSVLNQTFKDLQIVLVDIGSADSSGKICDDFKKNDSRIEVIHKADGSLSDALNSGLEKVMGEFVYFLNGDDYIKPQTLALLSGRMSAGECDLCISGYYAVNRDNEIQSQVFQNSGQFRFHNAADSFGFTVKELFKCEQPQNIWNKLFRMDVIRKHDLKFAGGGSSCCELGFSVKYVSLCRSAACISDTLCFCREKSCSETDKRTFARTFSEITETARNMLDFFRVKENGFYAENFHIILVGLFDILIRNTAEPADSVNFSEQTAENKAFFLDNIKKFRAGALNNAKILGKKEAVKKRILADYCIDWNYRSFQRKNKVLKDAKDLLTNRSRTIKKLVSSLNEKNGKIVLIGSEDFGNLGDQQIAVSIKEFLGKSTDREIVEITARQFIGNEKLICSSVQSDDIICLPGGGNIGNVYYISEKIRRDVIEGCPNNRIVIFPQTIHFDNTPCGQAELKKSIRIYNAHKALTLCLREQTSYDIAKKCFRINVLGVPDIVLSSDYSNKAIQRKNILLCIRNDTESYLDSRQHEELKAAVQKLGCPITEKNTELGISVDVSERSRYLSEYFDIVRSSKLVITDRLHGMIFAAITSTPCIVFRNYNHKVTGVYNRISYLNYIRLVESVEEIIPAANEIMNKEYSYSRRELNGEFEKLAELFNA